MTWTIESDKSTTWTEIDRVNENLIPYSEDFSKWTLVATVNGNVITDDSTGAAEQILKTGSSLVGDIYEYVSRCFSITVKKDNVPAATRFAAMRIVYGLAQSVSELRFDTSTGEIYNANGGVVEAVDYGVIDENDNWRFWITSKCTQYLYRISIWPAIGDIDLSVPAKNEPTGSITVINAQFETGTYPSRYLATNGTPVSWEVQ